MQIYNNDNKFKLIYQSIKSNNIDVFKSMFPDLRETMNKKQNYKNYILYALENNSTDILDYLFSEELKEQSHSFIQNTAFINNKNTSLNFLSLIIHSKKFSIAFNNLIKYYSAKNIQNLFDLHIEDYKILYHSITKLNKDEWSLYFNVLKNNIINQLDKPYVLEDTPPFIIVKFGQEHHLHLLKYFHSFNINSQTQTGFSPFLYACAENNILFIQEYLKLIDLNSFKNSFIQKNCLNSACFNKDTNVLKTLMSYLKDNNIPVIDTGNLSPLFTAFSEMDEEKILILLNIFNTDISEPFVSLSKQLKTAQKLQMLINIIPLLEPHHLENFSQNNTLICEFWSNVFLHTNLKDIQSLLSNYILKKSFENLKTYPELCHHLYNSSIVGRKDINLKIDFLLEELPIVTSNESEILFNATISKNELYFKTSKYPKLKLLKNFSLSSSLINLPATQIKNLIEHTQISKYLSPNDFSLIYSIGMYKKSLSLMKFIKQKYLTNKPIFKKELLNTNAFVQNNLILLQDNMENTIFNPKFKNKFVEILSFFEEIPNNFLSKIAFDLYSKPNINIDNLKNINFLFNNNEKYVASFHNSVIAFLLQQEKIPDHIKTYYSKSPNHISKICFSKLINFEKVENFSEKNLLKFLELSFFDPSENSILSEIDLTNDEDMVFQNIDTYENIKPNGLFQIFANHQLKNIQSKKYHPKIIKHYNLRTWTILFSILDSDNPFKEQFIDIFLQLTDFSIPTFNNFHKNISFENFQSISHHFKLPESFWNKLHLHYKDKHFELSHSLYLNYASLNKNINEQDFLLFINSVDELVKENIFDKIFSLKILKQLNSTIIETKNIIETKKNQTFSYQLAMLNKIIPYYHDIDLSELLNSSIQNNQFEIVDCILTHKNYLLSKINYDLFFNNDNFKSLLSNNNFDLLINIAQKISIKEQNDNILYIISKHIINSNDTIYINNMFSSLGNTIKTMKIEQIQNIKEVINFLEPVIHLTDTSILSEMINIIFIKIKENPEQKILNNSFFDILLKFNNIKQEIIVNDINYNEIKNFLHENNHNLSCQNSLNYFREFELSNRLDNSNLSSNIINKSKKKI